MWLKQAKRCYVLREGTGPITLAILPKSCLAFPVREECEEKRHFVTSQNPWLATPAMRHGFWLRRVTWGSMCTGFTCGSQEATRGALS